MRRLLTAVCAIWLVASSAGAQALKQVPANPMMLGKVNNLQAVNERLGELMRLTGAADANPQLANPLTALQEQLNILKGVNRQGELVVAMYDSPGMMTPPRPMFVIPVSDYKAFLNNFIDAKSEGEFDTFMLGGQAMFAAGRDGYAVLTTARELLVEKPQEPQLAAATGKMLAQRDMAIYINMAVVRAKVMPFLKMAKMAMAMPARGDQKADPAQQAQMAQALEMVEQFLEQCDALAIAATVKADGLVFTFMPEFNSTGSIAQTLAGLKNTDADLIGGLPDAKYLAMGGWKVDGAQFTKMIDFQMRMIKAAQPNMDPKLLEEFTMVSKAFLGATTGGSMGAVAPPADAKTGLLRVIVVMDGDAKVMVESLRKMMTEQMQKPAVAAAGIEYTVVRAEQPTVVDGVAFEKYTMQFKLAANGPQAEQMRQMMLLMYGESMTLYAAPVGDKRFVYTANVDEQLLPRIVAAAKEGHNPAADDKALAAVAAQLPANRFAVGYLSINEVVTLVKNFAAAQGEQLPIQLPADLPPMGMSMASDGSAIRMDMTMPADAIKAMIAAGREAAKQRPAAPRRRPDQL